MPLVGECPWIRLEQLLKAAEAFLLLFDFPRGKRSYARRSLLNG